MATLLFFRHVKSVGHSGLNMRKNEPHSDCIDAAFRSKGTPSRGQNAHRF